MSFNFRQNGQWNPLTIKERSGSQWATVGGGGGGGGIGDSEGWTWTDPPSRSNTEYTSDYSSIQSALNSIPSNTELVIDDGPYTEDFNLPNTNEITLSGGSGGATINSPHSSTSTVSGGGWSTTDTGCDPISEGDTTLSVVDASIFSPGDDLLIHDQTDVYKDMTSSDLRNTYGQYKGEFKVVQSVDTGSDTVTLESGTHQHYDDPNGSLEARNVDWDIVNFRWHNITLDGGISSPDEDTSGDDFRGLSLNRVKWLWITDSTFQNYHKDGFSNNACLYEFVDNCHATNYDRYGFSHSDGLTHARIRNSTWEDYHSYGVQCGGGATDNPSDPAPTYDIKALNCNADNSMRSDATWMGDAHFGAERVEYIDCSSNGARGMKIRGFDQHLLGGSYDCGGSTLIQTTQIVANSSVRNVYCTNGSRAWLIWPKEDQPIKNITLAESQFENMSNAVFRLRADEDGDESPPDIENLRVINTSFNGEWVDDAMIENSDGAGAANTTYTTEYPSDQTPAEYFA